MIVKTEDTESLLARMRAVDAAREAERQAERDTIVIVDAARADGFTSGSIQRPPPDWRKSPTEPDATTPTAKAYAESLVHKGGVNDVQRLNIIAATQADTARTPPENPTRAEYLDWLGVATPADLNEIQGVIYAGLPE